MLLQNGGNVNQATADEGWTPLIVSVKRGHAEVAKVLIRSGAMVNARTQAGHNAMYYARRGGPLVGEERTKLIAILEEATKRDTVRLAKQQRLREAAEVQARRSQAEETEKRDEETEKRLRVAELPARSASALAAGAAAARTTELAETEEKKKVTTEETKRYLARKTKAVVESMIVIVCGIMAFALWSVNITRRRWRRRQQQQQGRDNGRGGGGSKLRTTTTKVTETETKAKLAKMKKKKRTKNELGRQKKGQRGKTKTEGSKNDGRKAKNNGDNVDGKDGTGNESSGGGGKGTRSNLSDVRGCKLSQEEGKNVEKSHQRGDAEELLEQDAARAAAILAKVEMDLNACRAKKREARQRAERTAREEQEQTREKKEQKAARNAEIRQNKDARIAAENAAAKAESKAEEAQSRLECVVCLEGEKRNMFLPCCHVCVCDTCAKFIMRDAGGASGGGGGGGSGGGNRERLCPMCRTPVTGVMRVHV